MADTAATHRRSPMLDRPVLPTLARLAVPNTAATVVMIAPMLVEAWRLGALGGTALAGVALVFPLFMLSTMLSAGAIGGAFSGAVARALGAGDTARAEAVARSAFVVAVAGGLVMAVLVLGLGRTLFAALGGDDGVLVVAVRYADVLFPGIVLIWLFNMLAGVLRGSGDMVRPLAAVLVVAVLHGLASGPVILGDGASEGWGVEGAAALVLFAYGAGLSVTLGFLLRPGARVRLRPGRIDWALTRPILGNGLLAGAQSVMTIVTSLIVTGLAARLGPEVLAGYGIGARLELLMVPLIFGVGGAAIALGGAAAGAGLWNRAVRVGWTGAALAAAIVGSLGIVLALTGPAWAPAFTGDPTIVAVIVGYIERVGPLYGFFALGLALYFASQGLDTLLWPVFGTVARLVVVVVGGLLLFGGQADPAPADLFWLVAAAMASYGMFNAAALWLGPWRRRSAPIA